MSDAPGSIATAHRERVKGSAVDEVYLSNGVYFPGEVYLSIIVPIWNGADRLRASLAELARFVETRPYRAELLLANDGSGETACRVLEEFVAEHGQLGMVRHLPHRGKGAAIASGMLAASGRYRVFIDADLAYPATEIEKIVRELEAGGDVAIACRVLPASQYVMSPSFFHYLYTRHVMSRIFNAVVRMTLLPGILDTQGGLKGFTSAAAKMVFGRIAIPGFGFDLECLLIARSNGLRITQVPVVFRYIDEPSTVRILTDALEMLRDIVRVRWRSWMGRYTATDHATVLDSLPVPVTADNEATP